MPTVLPIPSNPVLAAVERRFRREKSLVAVRHSGLVESASTAISASRETSSSGIPVPLPVSQGGTGGTTAPTALSNLIGTFTGNALKVVRVNAGETDLEYTTAGSGSGISAAQAMAYASMGMN